jgi:hypothetical protein
MKVRRMAAREAAFRLFVRRRGMLLHGGKLRKIAPHHEPDKLRIRLQISLLAP